MREIIKSFVMHSTGKCWEAREIFLPTSQTLLQHPLLCEISSFFESSKNTEKMNIEEVSGSRLIHSDVLLVPWSKKLPRNQVYRFWKDNCDWIHCNSSIISDGWSILITKQSHVRKCSWWHEFSIVKLLLLVLIKLFCVILRHDEGPWG